MDTLLTSLLYGSPVLAAIVIIGAGKWLARDASVPAPSGAELREDGEEPAPTGYHWVTRPWRILPDGSRDYAHLHGKSGFRRLVSNNSRLRHSGDPNSPSMMLDGFFMKEKE